MSDHPLVRILGPVAIDDDLSPAPLNPRLRRLLAALAIHRGVPVSESALIEAVWSEADDLPTNPTRSLQTYVSRLRAHVGADSIERMASTYRLRIEGVRLDAAEFERLRAEADRAHKQADDRTAVERLDDALGHWSGEALGELASEPWAVAEAPPARRAPGRRPGTAGPSCSWAWGGPTDRSWPSWSTWWPSTPTGTGRPAC